MANVTGSGRRSESGPIGSVYGNVAVDAASIAAATTAETTVTFPGAVVNSIIAASPRSPLTTGLVLGGVYVKAAGVLAFLFGNVTTAAVDGTAVTFDVSLSSGLPS